MATLFDSVQFNHCYAHVDAAVRESLYDFRTRFLSQEYEHDGVRWEYVTLGAGDTTAVFLPGAIGTFYIWWQQLNALAENMRLISVSYPPEGSLEGLREGLNAVLAREDVDRFHILGSSMGGYLAQYIASTQPERLLSATFANTFVPTIPFFRAAPFLQLAVRALPLNMIHLIYRWFTLQIIVPAGGGHPLLKAYLKDVHDLGYSKQDVLARLACVTESFVPAPVKDINFPLLIIDSENDPLIRDEIRQAVRVLYPNAQHHSFFNAGHFAYLNQSEAYTRVLRSFLLGM